MLKRLSEYKEFIGILVVIVGGPIWLYSDFVTKEWLAQEIKLLNAQNEALLEDLEMLVSEVQGKNAQLQTDLRQQTCWDAAAFSMFRAAIEVSEGRESLHRLRLKRIEQQSRGAPEAALAGLQREIDALASQLQVSEGRLKEHVRRAGNWAIERCELAI